MNMTKKMNWRARPRRSYEESSDSKRQPATGRQRGGACWRVLARAGFYRLVWHPALFDLALFVVLLYGTSLAAPIFLQR